MDQIIHDVDSISGQINRASGSIVENTYVPVMSKTGYGEYNLWGTLREVVVGTPEGAMRPDDMTVLIERIKNVVDKEVLNALINSGDKRLLKDILPELYDGLVRETEELVKAYEKHNILVHRARPTTPGERKLNWGNGGSLQIFGAEPLWVVGRMVFENQWGTDLARAQVMAVREFHQPYIDNDPNILYFNAPTTSPDKFDYIYEGGDVLNLGDGNVIVATGHSSTNPRGAEWVARILRMDGYKPYLIELPDVGIHHLFAVLCVAGYVNGRRIAIAFRESFPNGLPEPMKDWDIIWTTRMEALLTGACCTMINPTTVVVPEETPRLHEELAKRGVTAVPVPMQMHAKCAGGNRCVTSVIRRSLT